MQLIVIGRLQVFRFNRLPSFRRLAQKTKMNYNIYKKGEQRQQTRYTDEPEDGNSIQLGGRF
jgi:DNA-binding transcriptional regulator YhcF (GntR family)